MDLGYLITLQYLILLSHYDSQQHLFVQRLGVYLCLDKSALALHEEIHHGSSDIRHTQCSCKHRLPG
jgi:hypothetical protein